MNVKECNLTGSVCADQRSAFITSSSERNYISSSEIKNSIKYYPFLRNKVRVNGNVMNSIEL